MLRKRMQQGLTVSRLGTILVLGAGCGGVGTYVHGQAPQPSDQHETTQGHGRDGHGAKSMRTSIVRLTAAPKGRGG